VGSTAARWIQTVAPGRLASASSGWRGALFFAGVLRVRVRLTVAGLTARLTAEDACGTALAVAVEAEA
jgi:hypothetical protein